MADTKGRLSGVFPRRDQVFEAVSASKRFSQVFVDQRSVKRALSALQRGPIHFHRNNVIACEGETADYIFFVVSGVLRSCRTFQNGNRNVVAFYLPGDLFGWSDQNYSLSVEAATDAMVLFLKRSALISVAARESRVAGFLLDIATNELHRAQERAVLLGTSAKSRVATFLTELSRKMGSSNSLDLPMSHLDIAEHLGLTVETLSRAITGLEQSGLISRVGTRTLILRNARLLSQVGE
jgi:CRP/FNR family transcriptional regulator, nitrogen fixation regulation protein